LVLEITPSRALLVLGIVLLIGFLGRWIFDRTKVPDTLLLMLVGFGIGYLFGVDTEPFMDVMPYVGVLALIAILFDGGLDLKFDELIKGLPRASLISFVGFGLSVLLVAIYTYFLLGFTFLQSALLGAIIGGTSAVIIIPLLKGINMAPKGRTMLGLESALTDVLCVVVALALATMIAEGAGGPFDLLGTLVGSFAIAIFLGTIAGLGWVAGINRIRAAGNEFVWTVTALFVLYGIVELLGGSGPIAVLLFGIILGNQRQITQWFNLPKRQVSLTLSRMQDEVVFFVRSFFFVFLGLVFDPSFFQLTPILTSPFLQSLGLFIVLIIARIGAVWIATRGDAALIKHRLRFVLLMPRGLAAAVLAALVIAPPYNIEGAEAFVSYAFAILLFSNIAATFAGFVGTGARWPRFGRRKDPVAKEIDRITRQSREA
jgi:potassium/hydrogen antiporter